MPITRHGIREILLGLLVTGFMATGLLYAAWTVQAWIGWLCVVPGALMIWVLAFFRDPERPVPEGPGLVVSPADGMVTHIDEVDEPTFLGGRARRVSIFMSLFNVHVNRTPAAGTVLHRRHRPGQFLNAMNAESAERNEAHDLGLALDEPAGERMLVRQIAGVIARRIVCVPAIGDHLARGERLGMVKFGSRLEVFVPATREWTIRVRVGQPVRAGATVLGELA